VLVIALLLAAGGIAAEAIASVNGWGRDLVVGWLVGAAGLVVLRRRPRDLVGGLLVVAAFAWFAGTLTGASGRLGDFGDDVLYAHRTFLLAALVAPLWRAGTTPRAAIAWLGVAVALTTCAALVGFGPAAGPESTLAVVVVATVAAVVAALVLRVAVPWPAMWGFAALATVVWGAAASTLRSLDLLASSDRLTVYQLGVVAASACMAASRFDRRPVVTQVVEVGTAGLGGALGDPRLRIGFADGPVYRAADGAVVVPSRSQESTALDTGNGAGRVLIVHRPGLLDDPRVRSDVEAAARLLADHHRLIAEVEAHAAQVEASRSRLLASEQRAVAGFAGELDRRVILHLDRILESLDATSDSGDSADRVRAIAALIRSDVGELTAGALPIARHDDPVAAIESMVASFPIAVELDLEPVAVDEGAGRVLYFVAAEALSNVLKHSAASSVDVHLRAEDGHIELRIEDDGTGEVAICAGGGLAGLTERVAAAGGRLECRARRPRGTAVIARLPQDHAR
jgi:signal transduction histidine kinase